MSRDFDRWVMASAMAATLSVLTTLPASAQHEWAAGLPGCAPDRPAVAHHADQQVLASQPTNGPVPCGMLTGYPTIENRIEVTNDGTIVFMPALIGAGVAAGGCGHVPGPDCDGNTVALSTDDGATWTTSTVDTAPDGPASGDVDNRLYVDHATGRLFYYDYDSGTHGVQPHLCADGNGATVIFSDDNGSTWDWGYDFEHNCSENPTVLVGKPRISTPVGYPSVVYLCGANFGTGIAGIGSTGNTCSKSLDGGKTWIGQNFQGGLGGGVLGGQDCYSGRCKDEINPYPECANGATLIDDPQSSSSGSRDVQPLPDGKLLTVISCGGNTYLSKSTDEGDTWKIQNRIPHGGILRADSQGNLFKLNGSLLSTSTNGGVTWSPEREMRAPGVVSMRSTHFAIGTHRVGHEIGRVAINYYGILEGETTSQGFITETRNALDPDPVFWSGQVNDPARPLLYNTPGSNMGVTVLDFTGSAFSPDGRSVWASFVQDCGTNLLTDPNCQSRWTDNTNPGNPQDGFAGRLVWPQ